MRIRRRGFTRVLFKDALVCWSTVSSYCFFLLALICCCSRQGRENEQRQQASERRTRRRYMGKSHKSSRWSLHSEGHIFPTKPTWQNLQITISIRSLSQPPRFHSSWWVLSLSHQFDNKKIYLFNRMLGTWILCLMIGNLKRIVIISMTLLFLSIKSLRIFWYGYRGAPPLMELCLLSNILFSSSI